MTCQLRIFLLGEPRFELADGRPLAFPGPKAAGMLACVAASQSRRVSRAELIRLLWADLRSTRAARHALRQCLLRLRAGLGPATVAVCADAEAIWLDSARVWIDIVSARRALGEGDTTRIRELSGSAGAVFCDGLEVNSPDFDDWLRERRHEAERLCVQLHRRASEDLALRGRLDEAVGAARRRVAVEPYEEAAHAALVSLQIRAGHSHAARRSRDACVSLFCRDLGVSPGDQLQRALMSDVPPPEQASAAVRVDPPRARGAIRAGLGGMLALGLLFLGGPDLSGPAPPRAEAPSGMSPWLTAASVQMSAPPSRTAGQERDVRAGIRGMLEGEADHAMFYPVGC